MKRLSHPNLQLPEGNYPINRTADI